MAADKALVYCGGGGIGDSLMASLVARALKEQYARVDALTLPAHAQTLERVPDIDEVLVDDGRPESELAQTLKQRGYDAAVVTWATPRTARIPQLANIPVRVGQSRRLYSFRFTHRVDVRSESGDVTTHWSQILLDYARAIGCDTARPYPAVVPSMQDANEAQALLAELGVERYAIVHAANAAVTQRNLWPASGWARTARALRESLGVSVLLSGSDADRSITAAIAAQSGSVNIAGRLSIGAFAALASRSAVFAGISTGAMHVAAAAGAPTVGIFPFQTDTPDRWGPLGERTSIVRATFPCRPGERKETCPDYACVEALDTPRIVAAARSLMQTAAA